jgi:non-ribosomal peptide synthetase component F
VVVRGVAVSYGEMERRARVMAAVITDDGARPVERVGVFASRSEVAYAGTLAALFSGAAFVPLNQKFPVERTRAMARRALLDAIVVDRASAPQLAAVLEGLDPRPLVIAPEPDVAASLAAAGVAVVGGEALDARAPLDALPPVLADDVAYLLFTSGTTGEPKGVGVTHANVLHYVDVMSERFRMTAADRCSQTFDQTFDLAVHDLFMAWNAGASVYAMQPIELLAPVRFVQKNEITVWFSVPSAPAMAIKKGSLVPGQHAHAALQPVLRRAPARTPRRAPGRRRRPTRPSRTCTARPS